jgi:hypothetical protein
MNVKKHALTEILRILASPASVIAVGKRDSTVKDTMLLEDHIG